VARPALATESLTTTTYYVKANNRCSVSMYGTHDNRLASAASSAPALFVSGNMHIAGKAADVGFVSFNFAFEFFNRAGLHRQLALFGCPAHGATSQSLCADISTPDIAGKSAIKLNVTDSIELF
jgi:hypothetical protein